jgi:hypothetical protein
MKRGLKIFILVFIVLMVATAGFSVYELLGRKVNPLFSQEFPDAVKEGFNETTGYKDFSEKCDKEGGSVVVASGGGEGVTCNCYSVPDDVGIACRGDYQCEYDCDFSQAISSGVCNLIFTDKDLGEETYVYQYECTEEKPGGCSSAPIDEPEWEMSGNILTETGYKEFPEEEEEFTPA